MWLVSSPNSTLINFRHKFSLILIRKVNWNGFWKVDFECDENLFTHHLLELIGIFLSHPTEASGWERYWNISQFCSVCVCVFERDGLRCENKIKMLSIGIKKRNVVKAWKHKSNKKLIHLYTSLISYLSLMLIPPLFFY